MRLRRRVHPAHALNGILTLPATSQDLCSCCQSWLLLLFRHLSCNTCFLCLHIEQFQVCLAQLVAWTPFGYLVRVQVKVDKLFGAFAHDIFVHCLDGYRLGQGMSVGQQFQAVLLGGTGWRSGQQLGVGTCLLLPSGHKVKHEQCLVSCVKTELLKHEAWEAPKAAIGSLDWGCGVTVYQLALDVMAFLAAVCFNLGLVEVDADVVA